DQPSGLQVIRDVFDLAPAQRMDINLRAQNDGLNSYGPGLWMFHDHVPTGTTTDGMEPGGNIAILAYKPLLDEFGMPKMHDELLSQVFNKNYYTKKQAVWGEGDYGPALGEAGLIAPNLLKIIGFGLAVGLIIGLLWFMVFVYQRKQKQ
ncbi:MAG: copper oxidase, partial [Methylococcales bacterium]